MGGNGIIWNKHTFEYETSFNGVMRSFKRYKHAVKNSINQRSKGRISDW